MTTYTYTAISLGNFDDLDTSDGGNTKSEQASRLLTKSFGSNTDPLYDYRTEITVDDVDGSGLIDEDNGTHEPISYDGSSAGTTLDSTNIYSIEITYVTSSGLDVVTVDATIIQDSAGNLFLLGDGLAAFEAGPIQSIR